METKSDSLIAVLWPEESTRKRGPKPSLSRQQIVETAIEVADTHGLDAVTMQQIAERLGRPKMSLYRYFPGRDELLALMADQAIGVPPTLRGRSWRSRLSEWATAAWPMFLAHSWLHHLTVGPRVIGPNELGWMEAALGALADTGLAAAEQLDAVALISGHLRSMATQESSGGHVGADRRAAGGMESGSALLMAEVLAEHALQFPLAASAFEQTRRSGGADQAVTFGIDRILDGLDRLIEQRQR